MLLLATLTVIIGQDLKINLKTKNVAYGATFSYFFYCIILFRVKSTQKGDDKIAEVVIFIYQKFALQIFISNLHFL